MTQTSERRMAVRDFSDQQIQTRIKAASQPGFGLEKASRGQLNMIYLLAKHYDVDPAVDITLYRDRPWFTIDGRIRLMKRHPQYAGFKTRPLGQQEKEAWGYRPDDLVVECTIRTRDWGEITARGKVTGPEQQAKAPTGSHPSEMAEKRAIARASRLAFGQDVPDEDEAGYFVEERDEPAKVAAQAQRYGEIYGEDEDHSPYELPPRVVDHDTGEVLEQTGALRGTPSAPAPAAPSPGPPVSAAEAKADKYRRNRELVQRAKELGVEGMDPLKLGAADDVVDEANKDMEDRIARAEWERGESQRQRAQEGLR